MSVDLHPVKQESFNTDRDINVDPKGFKRVVDTFRETDFGLYMGRGADHPDFGYLESWLLPELNLRVNIFHFREGAEKEQDFYIDVAAITRDGGTWHTRDLYVDLVSLTGSPISVMDIDELSAATSAGLISAEDTELAIETTLSAVEGITRNADDVSAWLQSKGIELTWANEVKLAPAGTR